MERRSPNSTPQLVSVKETARLLACSQANVYALIDQGELPVVRVGRTKGYRVDLRDLDAFIGARKFRYRQTPPPAPRRPLKHIRR